jgi:hypothetical protein
VAEPGRVQKGANINITPNRSRPAIEYPLGPDAVGHHIESGWFPNLIGSDQVRHFRIEDDRLILPADTASGRVRIIWTKLDAPPARG